MLRQSFCTVLLLSCGLLKAQIPTATTLTRVTPAAPFFGQVVTLTAQVTPGVAAAEVSFMDGGVLVGVRPLNNGIAQLATLTLPAGAHSLRAVYGGGTGYQPSQSTALPVTVAAISAAGFGPAANAGAQMNLHPVSVAVGDFNGDGKADMVVLDQGTGSVSIFLGNGNGTFQTAVNYDAGYLGGLGSVPTAVVVGDFNGDGRADLAVANYNNHVSVLLGNGDGTFQAPLNYSAGSNPNSIAVADFNLDGKVDLVLADLANAIVLLGNGNGTFQPALTYAAGSQPASVAVGDFNGDGQGDLAIANQQSNNVSVMLGNGNGTFQAAINYGVGSTPIFVAVGDFNADGKSDLAVANYDGNDVSVLLGNGNGTFQAAVNYDAGVKPRSLAVGDFNGDGRADLAVANEGSNNVSVLLGNGTGSFQPAVNYGSRPIPYSVAVGGFNGNGTADLAVVGYSGNTVVLSGTTSATANNSAVGVFRSGFFWVLDLDNNQQFESPPDLAFSFGGIPGDIPITGDWNGDGHTKVGIYRPSNGLFILDSNGDEQFDAGDAVYNLGVGTQAGDLPVVGDWNGDGRTKVGLFRQGFFWILDYNGNGVFEQGIDKTYAFGGQAGDVPVVGDWTGTGTSKIGLVRQDFFWILDANGNGTFDGTGTGQDFAFPFGGIAGDVPVVGDWNGDGTSKVGMFRQGFFWVLDANGNHQFDGTGPGQDLAFAFGGISGDVPVVGNWSSAPSSIPSATISLPANVSVPIGETIQFPVTLGTAAPAGGVVVTLTSSDSVRVAVSPTQVFISEGATTPGVQPTLTAYNIGTVTIDASAPGYTSATQDVKATATVTFSPLALTIDSGTTDRVLLSLSSAAPPGTTLAGRCESPDPSECSVTVALSSDDPNVVLIQPSVSFFPDGSSQAINQIQISAVSPGTTVIHAGAPPYIPEATLIVTVR